MKPHKYDPEVVTLLQARLADEYTAFYAYRNMSNWCQNAGFFRASKFYAEEAASELEHAKKIEQRLNDWNVQPALPPIPSPAQDFVHIGETLNAAYEMEYKLYEEYEDTSAQIFKMGEICVFDFLQFYRNVQNESVVEFSDKLNIIEGTDPADKCEMLLLEKKIFG